MALWEQVLAFLAAYCFGEQGRRIGMITLSPDLSMEALLIQVILPMAINPAIRLKYKQA